MSKKKQKEDEQNKPKDGRGDVDGSLRDRLPSNPEVDPSNVNKSNGSHSGPTGEEGGATKETLSNVSTTVKPTAAFKKKASVHSEVPEDSVSSVRYNAAGVVEAPVTPTTDASQTAYYSGGKQPDTRVQKLKDKFEKDIDDITAEKIEPIFKGGKRIQDSAEHLQGLNTRGIADSYKGTKVLGKKPQYSDFERSVDFHLVDSIVHTTGQVLDNITFDADYPTVKAKDNHDFTTESGYEKIEKPMKKSNYMLDSLVISLSDGNLSSVKFVEHQLPAHAEDIVSEQANFNWQMDRNQSVKTMSKLRASLGRESMEKWSPIGYVAAQGQEYTNLVHDIEATTGAMLALALRANISATAFQFNNTLTKDGVKPESALVEMFLRGIGQLPNSFDKSIIKDANINDIVFDPDVLKKGSAAAMLLLNENNNKYTKKSHAYTNQKGVKRFIQTLANNIQPLRLKKSFISALNTAHVYSTMSDEKEYNPLLPIVATDKIAIVNPLSLNYFLEGWSLANVSNSNPSGLDIKYGFKYHDVSNAYTSRITHPIVDGIMRWLIQNQGFLSRTYGANATINIPAYFSMLAPGMFQMILAAASKEILLSREARLKEYLDAGELLEGYLFDDLVRCDSLGDKLLSSDNCTITNAQSPIVAKKISDASFIHIFWGESYTQRDSNVANLDESLIGLPWYYSDTAFKQANQYDSYNGFYKTDGNAYSMSYPEVRQGINHEFIDRLMEISERDVRLSLDRAISIPLPVKQTKETSGLVKYNFEDFCDITSPDFDGTTFEDRITIISQKYSQRSAGRVTVKYTNSLTNNWIPTRASAMCLPRELGFLYPHFRIQPILHNVQSKKVVVRIVKDGEGNNQEVKASRLRFSLTGHFKLTDPLGDSAGHALMSYQSPVADTDVLSTDAGSGGSQVFYTLFADRSEQAVAYNQRFVDAVGIVPSISCIFTAADSAGAVTFNNQSLVEPYYVLGSRTPYVDNMVKQFVTLSSYTWTALNRFFMPINQFENCLVSQGSIVYENDEQVDADGNVQHPATPDKNVFSKGIFIDELEGCFQFGLAGFQSSNFEADVIRRIEIFEQLGPNYFEDEFINNSPVFRA